MAPGQNSLQHARAPEITQAARQTIQQPQGDIGKRPVAKRLVPKRLVPKRLDAIFIMLQAGFDSFSPWLPVPATAHR